MRSSLFHWLGLAVTVLVLGINLSAEAQTGILLDDYDPQFEGDVRAFAGTGGKYYVSGNFRKVNGIEREKIALIHPDESLDASFVPTSLGNGSNPNSAFSSPPTDIYPQPDGTVVTLGGSSTTYPNNVRRLGPDGKMQLNFGGLNNLFDTTASCISGGKFFHAGVFFTQNGSSTSYYRQIYRMDYGNGFNGRNLDPDFSTVNVEGTVYCMLPLPDGRIVIGGSFTHVNSIPRRSLAIINADGTLDSFNMQVTDGAAGLVTSLAAGIKDGVPVIYFGGFFTTVTLGSTSVNAPNLSFFRPQDPTFISTTFKPAPNQSVQSLLVLPNQTLVLGGNFLGVGGQPRAYFAMIRPDGTLMPDPGLSFSSSILVLGYDPADGGRILAGGSFTSVAGMQRKGFARLAVHAIMTATASPQAGTVRASAQQLDGKIWVGGDFASSASLPRSHLARLNSDTTLDTSVDVAVDGPVNAIAALPDGRVLIGGAFTHLGTAEAGRIARLNANGSIDSSFALQADGEIHAISMRVDGSCYVAGSFSHLGGEARAGIARVQADGTLDSTFAPALDGPARCVLPLRDGKLLVGGEFANVNGAAQPWLARLNADGTLDATFAPQLDGTVNALHLLLNGDVLAGGQFTHFLRKLAPDGNLRADFTPSVDGPVRVLCGLADDSTLVGGSFVAQISGQPIYGITRLNNGDGTVLPAPAMSWASPAGSSIHTLLPLGQDGRLLAGGQFTLPLSMPRSGLVAFVAGSLPEVPPATFSHNTPLTEVRWNRTGSVPQLTETFIDLSTDNGATWTSLGSAQPEATGWAVPTSMNVLPVNKDFLLRARGVSATGGSGSFFSQTENWKLSTPVLLEQPGNWSMNAGESVLLSAYSQSPGSTYQWYKNGQAIPEATRSSLRITGSLDQQENGTYHAVVSNVYGSTTSRSAVIQILRLAPVIQVQPGNASVIATGYASFLVSARNGPLSFQWYKGDELIPGATNNELVVRNTGEIFDTPKYKVVVSNLIGSVTSQAATLTVTRPIPTITREPEDVTVVQGQQFTLSVEAAWLNITQHYRWYFNGQPVGGSQGSIFSLWSTPASAGTYRVEVSTPFGSVLSREVQVTVLSAPIVTITGVPAGNTAISGTAWQITTAVTGGGPYSYQWQYTEYDTPYNNWWNDIPGAVSETLNMAAGTPHRPGYYRVQVSNSRGTILSARVQILVLIPVRITGQPEDQDLNADAPITISPVMDLTGDSSYTLGWPNIQFQWFKDGEEIPGATSWEFSKAAAVESDSGDYKLRVTNAAGVVETRTATITVSSNSPPVVLAPPQPRFLLVGQPLDLSIEASGRHVMTATWRRNGARLPNGHGVVKNKLSTFSRNATAADSGQYSVMLVNDLGAVFSPQAQVVVVDPAGQTFIQAMDTTVTFPAASTASGTNVQYQWLKAGTPVTNSDRISGSTSASLRISALSEEDSGAYTCRVTFGGTSLNSGSHALTVLEAVPEITSETLPEADLRLPYSANLGATHSASSFKVTGLPPGLILNAATGEISGVPTKTGLFKLQATASNAFGKGATKPVLLEVNALPEELAGYYFGVFEHDDSCPGGHVSLTLNSQGSGSGKLQLGTQTFAFKGTFQRSQLNAGILLISGLKHKELGTLDLGLALDIRPDGQSEMVATADYGGGWLYAVLRKSSWSKTNRPLAYEGYHTFSFASGPAESAASGHSYGSVTVSSTGLVSYAGKLADNTVFTSSIPLSDDGDTGLFAVNDRARNFVNAPRLSFDIPDVTEGQEQNQRRSHRLYGSIRWLKNEALTSKSYPEGFDIRTELLGSRYLEPGTAGTSPLVMNLEAGDELALFFEGASTGLDFLDEYMPGTLKAGNVATFQPDDMSTFNSVKVTIKPKTGVFTITASFNLTLWGLPGGFEDAVVKRTLTGSGIIISDHEISSGSGRGFMLTPGKDTSEILSAPIRLE